MAMEEVVEEASSTMFHPCHPPPRQTMILPPPSAVKLPQQSCYKPMVQDEAKICMTTTLFGPFHKDEIIKAVFLSHYFFLAHVVKKVTEHTNKYAKDNCNKRKRGKRAPHPEIFGHILSHGSCWSSFQKRLHEPGQGMVSPSIHVVDEQGYVWIYFPIFPYLLWW